MLASSLSIGRISSSTAASQATSSLTVIAATAAAVSCGADSVRCHVRWQSCCSSTALPLPRQEELCAPSCRVASALLDWAPCSLRSSKHKSRRHFLYAGSSGRGSSTGGLLHSTRVAHALVPIAPVHADRRGAKGGTSPPRFVNQSGQPASRANIFTNVVNVNVAPALVEVRRSPQDLLDDMPVYPPSDFNGPPLTRQSLYTQMRTLPQTHAIPFFFREQGTSGGLSSSSSSAYRRDAEEADEERGGHRHSHSSRGSDNSLYCRLCREEVQSTVRTHLTVANTGSHVNHPVREIVLDSLALLAIRGYPIDDVLLVWAETLFNNPALPRIPGMTDPRWTIEQRAHRLGDLMHALKKAGVIDISLSRQGPETANISHSDVDFYRRRRIGFERLEYIGDSFWGIHVAQRLVQLFPDQQWLYGERSFSFNAIRDAVEMNVNLDFVFDVLRIDSLLSVQKVDSFGTGKAKADFVESILGELHMYAIAFEPKLDDTVAFVEVNGAREAQLCALVQHCLTELYDLVVLQHARQLLSTAVPLAKELAVQWLWQQPRPPLLPAKRSSRGQDRGVLRSLSGSGGGVKHLASQAPWRGGEAAGFFGAASAPETTAAAYEELSDLLPANTTSAAANADDLAVSLEEDDDGKTNAALDVTGALASHAIDDGLATSTPSSVRLCDPDTEDADSAGEPVPPRATSADDANAAASTDAHAVERKLRGAVLPTFTSLTLTLASAVQRGSTRVLPGLPRLFTRPHAMPTRVPHSLRHLPLSKIPQMTYCAHTKTDVFAQLIASYRRLGLVPDDASLPRYVVSPWPPQWAALVATLVPQLTPLEETEEVSRATSDVDGGLHASSATAVGGPASKTGECLASPVVMLDGARTRSGETQAAARARRLLTVMDGSDVYCRDGFYDVHPSPLSANAASVLSPARGAPVELAALPTPCTVQWTLEHCGLPRLTPKPTQAASSPNGGVNAGDGFDNAGFGIYADSRFVPPGTRLPSAGVVTDRNLCRGAFAFLAVGVADPIKRAARLQTTVHMPPSHVAKSAVADQKTNTTDGQAVVDSTHSTDEVSAEMVELAFLYWKRQRRDPAADADLFITKKSTAGKESL